LFGCSKHPAAFTLWACHVAVPQPLPLGGSARTW
jgi:hypothetical protein